MDSDSHEQMIDNFEVAFEPSNLPQTKNQLTNRIECEKIDKNINMNQRDRTEDMQMNEVNWNRLAIEIKNLWFKYGNNKNEDSILKDIDMSVPESSIYGLLGPSGCGKTTLLRHIVGRLKPKSGTVSVFGSGPGHAESSIPGPGVGYMPQELALYNELTINETLTFFASIYGMKKDHTHTRIKVLLEFLDLPDPKRIIKNLSGGQKRRVSLATALIHTPPLLILDEPTVGVDPILREKIWQHLLILSQQNMTIVITTHYIEEARKANIVSLMRNGELLIEQNPDELLNYFQVSNLEDVFLKICHNDVLKKGSDAMNYFESRKEIDKIGASNSALNSNSQSSGQNSAVGSQNELIVSNMGISHGKYRNDNTIGNTFRKFAALSRKNFIRIRRNIPALVFNIFLPSIQIVLFCTCVGKDPFGLKFGIYNPETQDSAKLIYDRLNTTLSNLLLNQIDTKILTLTYYNSSESVIDSVKSGETYGAFVFEKNFSMALLSRMMSQPIYEASNDTIEHSTVKYYADMTNLEILSVIARVLIDVNQMFLKKLIEIAKEQFPNMKDLNANSFTPITQIQLPPVYGSINPRLLDFMAPGILLSVVFILALGLTSSSFVIEKMEGLLDRTLVAGVKIYHILMAHALVQTVLVLIQTTLMLLFLFLVFEIPNKGSIALVVVMSVLQGTSGMCLGLVISAICNNIQTAIMLAMGTFYPSMILSGTIWPIESMPVWLRYISYVLPQTMQIISIRNIMLRGWQFSRPFVYLGFVSNISWITFLILAASLIAHLKN